MNNQNFGVCKDCGAPMAKNPKTGKIFCSEKCWLNQPQKQFRQPVRQEPNWDSIRAQKEEHIEYLNAKNVASTLLAAAIQSKEITLKEAMEKFRPLTNWIYTLTYEDTQNNPTSSEGN